MNSSLKISALVLSLWMFVLSTGINVYKHYCEGSFEGISLLIAQEACEHDDDHEHMVKESSCCEQTLENKSCCVNDVERISIEEDYLTSSFHFDVPVFILSFINILFSFPTTQEQATTQIYNQIPDPPPLSISIEGITQCFRL